MQTAPTIVWVVGDNTNVGKTTISASLIRVLNRAGKPTVGFKPYAGGRLVDVIDLLGEIATGDGFLVGRDARKLAKASPLMSSEWLEVANPSWRLSHPHRDVSVFVRKGADGIGQRSFFHTANAEGFRGRPGFQQLNEFIRLPIAASQMVPNVLADQVDYLHQDVQGASFDRLMTLGPAMVVCEGAGRLLPAWKGAPPASHVFLITGGDLHLFSNVALDFLPANGADDGPLTIAALGKTLGGHRSLKASIPLAPPTVLDDVMDRFVTGFLQALL